MRQPGTIRCALLVVLTGLLAAILASPRPGSLSSRCAASSLGSGSRGQLAYIGADGNVYVVGASLQTRHAITTDATAPAEGSGRSYHRLTWSPDNQLAFAAVIRSGNQATGQLYVASSPGASPRAVAEDPDHFIIYIHWSPAPCPDRPACSQLAYLVQGSDGVDLHLVTLEGSTSGDRLLGTGRPFYFSWAPGRPETEALMAWHTGPAGSSVTHPRLALYDLGHDQVLDLALLPGSFLAPAWSPQGDHWLAVTTEDGENRLRLFEGDRPAQVLLAAEHDIAFSWSPDGEYVAYATREFSDDPFYGPVYLVDMTTGQPRQLTSDAFRVRGFFWAPGPDVGSPHRQRLAYLTWLDLPDGEWGQWRVIDVPSRQDRGFAAFNLSPLMRFAIHSFGQYAQSHRFWAPDGRYLVYADRDRAGIDTVWLVDTWAKEGREPIFVAEGSLAYWSWQ